MNHVAMPVNRQRGRRTKMLLWQDPEVTLYENFVSQEEAPSMRVLWHPSVLPNLDCPM